jgi:hypothetical protein
MMEWITVTRGRDTLRVRPRGLDALLAQGWQVVGANQVPEQSTVQVTTQDSGPIKVRPRKTK